jgi:hypothetical protein
MCVKVRLGDHLVANLRPTANHPGVVMYKDEEFS